MSACGSTGRIDDAQFRRIILVLLGLSGLTLIGTSLVMTLNGFRRRLPARVCCAIAAGTLATYRPAAVATAVAPAGDDLVGYGKRLVTQTFAEIGPTPASPSPATASPARTAISTPAASTRASR